MTTGAWIAAASVLLAVLVGAFRYRGDGRFAVRRRAAGEASSLDVGPAGPAESEPSVSAVLPAEQLGERATLLQFSSAFCAPCRATRRVLADVAAVVPGVAHVEIDAEQRLDLVRRLGVVRTPTTLVLDRHGREATRASGAPRKEQVLAALTRLDVSDDGYESQASGRGDE